jgi:hypothetical protein
METPPSVHANASYLVRKHAHTEPRRPSSHSLDFGLDNNEAGDASNRKGKSRAFEMKRSKSMDFGAKDRRDSFLRDEGRMSAIHPSLTPLQTTAAIWTLYVKLQWFFGTPGLWIVQAVRMIVFVMLLLPGLLPWFWTYLRTNNIKKNIVYGSSFRHQVRLVPT